MRRIPITLGKDEGENRTIAKLERACRAAGLRTTMKGPLKTIPGSIHWHFKFANQPGVLEMTYCPGEDRAWFSIHGSREAKWMGPIIQSARRAIARGQ